MRWAALAVGLALAWAPGPLHAEDDGGPKTVSELLDDAHRRAESGRLVEALRSGRDALALAIAAGDADTIQAARVVVEDLLKRIPHVTFSPPSPAVEDLYVEFDHRLVPIASLSKKFSVDPGRHEIVAQGVKDGHGYSYQETIELTEGEELTTIHLLLVEGPMPLDYGVNMKCVLEAKTEEDVQRCIDPSKPKGGCRSCASTSAPLPDPLSSVVLVLFTIAGSRASSSGSRRTRGRAGGKSRTREADRPRS